MSEEWGMVASAQKTLIERLEQRIAELEASLLKEKLVCQAEMTMRDRDRARLAAAERVVEAARVHVDHDVNPTLKWALEAHDAADLNSAVPHAHDFKDAPHAVSYKREECACGAARCGLCFQASCGGGCFHD